MAPRPRPDSEEGSAAAAEPRRSAFVTFVLLCVPRHWKNPIEVRPKDFSSDLRARADLVERRQLLVVDRAHPAARKERRVAAEQQAVGPGDREGLTKDVCEAQPD